MKACTLDEDLQQYFFFGKVGILCFKVLFFLNGVSGWKFEMILNEMIFELKCCREVLKCFFQLLVML